MKENDWQDYVEAKSLVQSTENPRTFPTDWSELDKFFKQHINTNARENLPGVTTPTSSDIRRK